MSPRSSGRSERGSAVVDFVLVLGILVPVVFGILQVALVLQVRNTLAAAASDGARYGATYDHEPAEGVDRARDEISGALAARFARSVSSEPAVVDGAPGLAIVIRARVPALGLGGPGVELVEVGHAVLERP